MSNPLDELTPLHFIAHLLHAEDRRVELGLPEGAAVYTTRWLVTRNDLRAEMVERAKAWAVERLGSVAAAESSVRSMPDFAKWVREETWQAEARAAAR